MAPSISPICRALLVPIACADVPSAKPFASGSVMRQILQTVSPSRLPTIPVRMMTAPASAAVPPSVSATSMPMAVVTDFGKKLTAWVRSSLSTQAIASTLPRLVSTPAAIDAKIAARFFSSSSHFSYSGIARLTVAGIRSQFTGWALDL